MRTFLMVRTLRITNYELVELSNFQIFRPPSHTHARWVHYIGVGGRPGLLMGDTVAEAVLSPAVLLQRASFLHSLETGI